MPSPRPSPAATMIVMEMMPQAMPNMVRRVRRFCAQSVTSVSRRRSRKDTGRLRLLQNDFLLFCQTRKNFSFDAVGDTELNANFLFAVGAFGVGNFDLSVAVLVVNHGGFRGHDDVLLFFEKNF